MTMPPGSTFEGSWLALREAADAAARDAALVDLLLDLPRPQGGPLRIVDLGAGAGSNLRWLAPRLAAAGLSQHWTLIDHDPHLLELAFQATFSRARDQGHEAILQADTLKLSGAGVTVEVTRQKIDLSPGVEGSLLDRADLVTASALLDLVSSDWIDQLAQLLHREHLPFLAALTYDGEMAFEPGDNLDLQVTDLFNRHQRRDKGFGPALGPAAARAGFACFAALGFDVHQTETPWQLGAGDGALMRMLTAGIVDAACEEAPSAAERLRGWEARRREQIAAGDLRATISHSDLLALPG